MRPVSQTAHGELSKDDCLVRDDGGWRDIAVLDIVDAEIGAQIGAPGQPENHLFSSGIWSFKSSIGKENFTYVLDSICEEEDFLLHGDGRSVALSAVDSGLVKRSLVLIKVQAPNFFYAGYSKLRCSFKYSGREYDLPITDDSAWVSLALVHPERFSTGTWYFTISLGEAFRGQMWKLIASGISARPVPETTLF